MIYEIFLATQRKKTTADKLNRLGHRTRKGALFSGTTVARLLKDTTAKGERIANYTKTSADGKRTVLKPKSDWTVMKCPAIILEKTWNKANHILACGTGKKKHACRQKIRVSFVWTGKMFMLKKNVR